jgi:hypothetical protein
MTTKRSRSETHLHELAGAFRKAIIDSEGAGLVQFQAFPSGACGDASILLAQFLSDSGYGTWNYVSGERRGDRHSHAWVEQSGLIVDITADQFEDVDDPVIVTRDATWHTQFLDRQSHIGSIAIYDDNTQRTLRPAYDLIKTSLLNARPARSGRSETHP